MRVLNNMENKKYSEAEKYFESGDYAKAYYVFKGLTEDKAIPNDILSDAYNMMGLAILFDTRIDNIEDESGLNFFSKSIGYNPHNIGALFNIITQFGVMPNCHQDVEMLEIAVQTLNDINYEFTEYDKFTIKEKLELKDKIFKNGD